MNLLVTNTRNAQAYAIIRALRPYARKIVVTMEGDNRLSARLSHAVNSRLVDRRYYTPSPVKDWRAGRIQRDNTEREEAYIRAIAGICEAENIDTIFPSFDPHVYVFAKNKERFEKMGVLIPIPDYEVILVPLDKYRTFKAAKAAGFPVPRTYLPKHEHEAEQIADKLGYPLLIKPRFTAGGRGTARVNDLPELREKIRPVIEAHGMPLLQEFVPGNQQENIHVVMDKAGETKLILRKLSQRFLCNGNFTVYREIIAPGEYAAVTGRLLRELGWWGGALIELKVDDRDKVPKLMEINPRFGSGIVDAVALGMNAPWMCVRIGRGENVKPEIEYPAAVYVHPVEDALVFGLRLTNVIVTQCRSVIQRKHNGSASLKELLEPYKAAYFNGKKKRLDLKLKYLLRDPLVLALVWLQYFLSVLRAMAVVGR